MAEPNKMLIDATHPEETRVVVLRGGRVEEFDYESAARKQLRGNIYLAKVTRVEPSLQAAFVEYGGNRHGFLAFNEIHPDYYQIPVADRIALIEEEAAAEAAEEAAAEARAEARAKREAAREAARLQRAAEAGKGAASVDEDVNGDGDEDDDEEDDEVSEISTIDNVEGVASYAESDGDGPDDGDTGDEPAAPATRSEASGLGEDRISEPMPQDAARDDDATTGHGGGHTNCDHDHDQEHEHTHRATDDAPLGAVPSHAEGVAEASAAIGAGDVRPEDNGERRSHKAKPLNGDADETVEQVGAEDALEELPSRPRRRMRNYKIQEVIKRRQVILVQVVKEERGNKGAALTTYLSLAGRYTVLMPNTARGGGISRKITQPQDRKRLKAIAAELEVPEGMGLIIRTAGAARTKQEIKRDFEYLLRLWESVRDLTLQSTAPSLVYEEGNLIKRSIRDLYNKDVEEVIVAGNEAFVEARDFMRMLMPSHAKNVINYASPEPLFTRYQIERQLNAMFSPYVTLKSGGYLVINQTEALVAVDVNSGKSTREFSIEETALNTNLEAADEIARQLKLRDLAGLIVVDFIDMEEKRNNRAVERRLKDALRFDRARIQVGRISHFGLMEMSRQRLRTGVLEGSTSQCPHCQGTGIIRSVESVALAVLRGLEDAVMAGARTSLIAVTTPSVALYILNKKRNFIIDMEARLGMPIHVEGSDKMQGANFAIEKGTAPALPAGRPHRTAVNMDWGFGDDDEAADNDTMAVDADEAEDVREPREAREERHARGNRDRDRDRDGDGEGESNGDGRRRRRRRRRGRRGEREATAGGEVEAVTSRDGYEDDEAEGDDDTVTTIGEASSHTARDRDGDVDNDSDDAEGDSGDDEEANGETAEQAGANGDQPRRRRRRGRRGGRRNRDRQDRPGENGASAADTSSTSGEPNEDVTTMAPLAAATGDTDDPAVAPRASETPQAATLTEAPRAAPAGDEMPPRGPADMPPAEAVAETAAEPVAEAAAPPAASADTEATSTGQTDTRAAATADSDPESDAKPRRSRGEPVSSAPRMERVVVSPDQSGSAAAIGGDGNGEGDSQPTRKGWWQRRFGV